MTPYQPHHPITTSTLDDAPLDSATIAATTARPYEWTHGLQPVPRNQDLQPDSTIVLLWLVLATLIAFEAPSLKRLFKNLDTDLLGIRRRDNAFDSHTASESRALGLLIIMACLCQAVIIGIAVGGGDVVSNMSLLGTLMGVTAGYYIFQLLAYRVMGYTFTDKVNATQWLKGFHLSQGLTGLVLALPAVTALYYHKATTALLVTAATLYIIVRIAFICKGFRIFYTNLPSLVYFILYLCALEVIPVIIIVTMSRYFDKIMQ